MDRYQQYSSNSASGFVYFNQDSNQEYQNKSDTTDFLAFSDPPQASPQTNRFKPAYSSSPQSKYHRGSPRNYPPNYRKYQRWTGGNRSNNSSYNSSFNQSSSLQEDDQGIAKFVHPSFLEDPWAHLEAKLKQNNSQINDTRGSESEET